MAEFNINNLLGRSNTGATPATTNFDSLVNLARGQLENISQEVQNLINQSSFSGKSLLLDAGGVKVQLPQLANLVTGQQDILLKTAFPIDKAQNFNIQVQNSNVVLDQGKPVLQLQGQIIQNNLAPQKFTAEIPLQSLATQGHAGPANATTAQNSDQVVRNFLPENNVTVSARNLNETIRPLLPQNLQNLNLGAQNNLNAQINSFTTPSGQQIVVNQNQIPIPTSTQQPQQIMQQGVLPNVIQGQVEIFPDANEALIRTEFGTFRVPNLTQLPNGSTVNFTITGQPAQPAAPTNNILNLNPTNIQALRLNLEASDSPLQNLLRSLNSSQGVAPLVQRFFPHPDDKTSYARSLMFLSSVVKGAPEGWLGDDGQMIINSTSESDTNMGRLQEVFGVLRNFTGHGEQKLNLDWNSYIIPLYDGNKLSFVTIQVQRDPDGSDRQNTRGKRKFILELEQDDLGRVAIEGLYSKVEGKVDNLDVVLKTEKDVDDAFKAELINIFNETATAYNFNGSLNFMPFTTATPLYTDVSKILGDGIVI